MECAQNAIKSRAVVKPRSNTTQSASAAKPQRNNPRHPDRTLLYRIISEHFETWLELASAGQFDGQGDHRTPRSYVRQAFRKYLEYAFLFFLKNRKALDDQYRLCTDFRSNT